jgi:valyl-tRNA synthetase
MEEAFLSYRFNDAAQAIYEFFWNDFCDWYVEATKLSIRDGGVHSTEPRSGVASMMRSSPLDTEKDRATTVLLDVLSLSLRLLHPLLSFVTEEIYSRLPNVKPGELLITAPYPVYDEKLADEKAEHDFSFLQDIVRQIRTLRSECTISPDKKIKVLIRSAEEQFLNENSSLVKILAGIAELKIEGSSSNEAGKPAGSIGLAGNGFEAFVFIAEVGDTKILKQKFSKELERDLKYIEGLKAKLANNNFLKNAPQELVEAEKLKLEEAVKRTGKIESYIRDMA